MVGQIIDRFGPRRVGLLEVALFGCAFAALGLNNGSQALWFILWVCVAIATSTVKPIVWTAAVASRFHAAQGLAIALALTGTPLTGMLTPGVSNALLDAIDWRGAYPGIVAI